MKQNIIECKKIICDKWCVHSIIFLNKAFEYVGGCILAGKCTF